MKLNKIFYSLVIITFSMLVFTGYYYTRIQEEDAVKINLAGRQRMLSQKIFKEILLYKIGEKSIEDIEKSIQVFTETENALLYGGPAPLDLDLKNYRVISPSKDRIVVEKLVEIKKEWDPIVYQINENLKKDDKESLKYIIIHDSDLLNRIGESVTALQLISEKNNSVTGIIILSSFLIISMLLVISLLRKMKEIRRVKLRITELETLLPICSSCKKIRTDNDRPLETRSWTTIESYLHDKKDMTFTHSICPDCINKMYPGMLEEMKKKNSSS